MAPAQEQVTYTPASGHLYSCVQHPRKSVVESLHLRLAAVRNLLFTCSAVHGPLRSIVRTPSQDHRGTCDAVPSTLAPGRSSRAASSGQLRSIVQLSEDHHVTPAHQRHFKFSRASRHLRLGSGHLLNSYWTPVEMHRGTICAVTIYQQSSVWCICITWKGHMHSSVRAYMHQCVRYWVAFSGKHFCSV
jgi:hypothetical protein